MMIPTTTTTPTILLFIIVTFVIIINVEASLLTNFIADKVDNRPSGRYRFSMFCYQWTDDYSTSALETAVGILGGSSTSEEFSADFHMYLPDRDEWFEQSDNSVSFVGRHSMVAQPVYSVDYDHADVMTSGGFVKDPLLGTTIVEDALVRYMAPPDPEFPEDDSWIDPAVDEWSSTPGARARAASFVMGESMYIFSGISPDGIVKGDLWRFAPESDSYVYELIYAPYEDYASSGSSDYFDDASQDEYGGDSFTGFSYSSSSESYYYYGSSSSASSNYYYDTGSSSSSSTGGYERNAAAMEEKKSNPAMVKVMDPQRELIFLERAYERDYKRRMSRLRRKRNHQKQQQQVSTTSSTSPFFREANAESFSGELYPSDRDLYRYGACCATLGPADGPDALPPGSSADQFALCFGGGEFRSVIKYQKGDVEWFLLNVLNPKDGPKPVRDPACTYNQAEGTFIVFGGYDSRTGSATTDTRIYSLTVTDLVDAGSAYWNSTRPLPNFAPVYGHQMCSNANRTWMFGGKSTFRTNSTLFELDFSAGATDIKLKEATPPLLSLPVERAYHVAAATGTAFFVGFGRKKEKMHADFWKYDLLTESWSAVQQSVVAARWGASAAVFGSAIFIFGGRATLTGTLCYADLVAYEATKDLFTVISASADAPSARAFHVSFASGGSVVVGLGQDNNGNILSDWHAFSPVTQTWTPLTVVGDRISGRIGASAVQSFNETHSVVGLGYNSIGLNDWYFVEVVDGSKLISRKVPIDDGALEARITRRSFASVAGRGRHVLVCGGLQSAQLAAPPDGLCYQIDMATGEIGHSGSNRTSPVGLVAAPAVYAKDSIFIFSGQIISPPTVSDVFYKRMIRIRGNSTCANYVSNSIPNDDDCILCGFGSSGPSCAWTSPGFYTTAQGRTLPCQEGTFSVTEGGASPAVCTPCPFGTFGNTTGRSACVPCDNTTFCPVGTSVPIPLNSARTAFLRSYIPATGVLIEENPGQYEAPSLPWFPVGIVAGFAVALALLVALILGVNYKFYQRRLHYFFPDDVSVKLDKIFVTFATNGRDMSLAQLICVFHNLKMSISPTLLQKAFEDQVDDTGRPFLGQSDFKKVWMDLIRVGVLPPFENSDAKECGAEPEMCLASVGSMRLSNFDSFRNSHMPAKLGEPRRVIQTHYGGLFSLVLYVAQIIVILAILVDFVYNNVVESKSIVPYPVIQAAFGEKTSDVMSDFVVKVGITGPLRTSSRYDPSDDPVTKAEKVCLDIGTRNCNNETKVTPIGVTIPRVENSNFDCEFDRDTRQCFVVWYCRNCTVVSAADITFTFSSAQSANRVDCNIVTTTGIHKPWQSWTGQLKIAAGELLTSSIHEAMTPANPALVFSGFPATTFHFGLAPTYFDSVELVNLIAPASENTLDLGYHLRPDANPTRGNSIAPELFGTYYDAPVKVSLTTDSEILYVRRQFVQSMIELVTSLLGAISGVGGAFLAATNFIDERSGNPITLDENGEEVEQDKEEYEEERMMKQRGENRKSEKKYNALDGEVGAAGGGEGEEESSNNNSNTKNVVTIVKKEDEKGETAPKKRKLMKLPGQSSGTFDLIQEASFSATSDAEARRLLPLVSLGLPVDIALGYHQILKAPHIPSGTTETYELEKYKQEVLNMPPIHLNDVKEMVVDEEELKLLDQQVVKTQDKYKEEDGTNETTRNGNDDDDVAFSPQVIHVESRRQEDAENNNE